MKDEFKPRVAGDIGASRSMSMRQLDNTFNVQAMLANMLRHSWDEVEAMAKSRGVKIKASTRRVVVQVYAETEHDD